MGELLDACAHPGLPLFIYEHLVLRLNAHSIYKYYNYTILISVFIYIIYDYLMILYNMHAYICGVKENLIECAVYIIIFYVHICKMLGADQECACMLYIYKL